MRRTIDKFRSEQSILPRDAPEKRGQWTAVALDAEHPPASAPLMSIVIPDLQRGGGFQERVILFFAFLTHRFGTSGIFLEH